MHVYRYPSRAAEARIRAIVSRSIAFRKKDVDAVRRIVEDVRRRGDTALIEYVHRFDAPDLAMDQLRVRPEEVAAAARQVDQDFLQSLERACTQIEAFHRHQAPRSWVDTSRPGTLLGQLVRPVDAAGVYVPGGKGGSTPLVSSVLMGAIPARIAGVERIVMATPPMSDGRIDPHLLAAAARVGVHEIYRLGSAWAIAALAYGTNTIRRVDTIVGPGNVYVTLAKKLVAGTVGIDMIAGPSEILVIADASAAPRAAAADLLSQAEHDPLASAIMLTDSQGTARKVAAELVRQTAILPRRDIAEAALKRFGAIIVVPDLDTALDLANRMAPEHLELLVAEPFGLLSRIRNAGAVFLGAYSPEPVGDYIAGPNHVLPTAGTARFSSALSVDHFTKRTSLIHYDRGAFAREAPDVLRLARIEGLEAHAQAVRVRLETL
jgi:histidinol dehydrogenase